LNAAKVFVFQHTPPENLGTIADALARRRIAAHYIRGFQEEPIPRTLEGISGLVVMGGQMGVADRDRVPFLKAELHLIELALKEQKPVLGICLGSQLLAHVLGARVTRADRKEIGWSLVRLSEEGRTDPLFAGVEPSFFALHWHGDVFELPQEAVSLASSEQTACQVFRYGRNAYGLLCHLEMTENTLREMIRTFSDELQEENLDAGWLLKKGEEHFPPLERISETVFGHWAAQVT
jgi:GMP synthase (glutamine-hydrolysing)